MRAPPQVTVVVPARDASRWIGGCLRSIRACADPGVPWELVVVDNGSRDGTAAIAQEHGARCVDEPRRGRAHARNRGIAAARGEVVAFVDADCVVSTGWLRELAGAFRDPAVVAVAGEIFAFPPRRAAERYAAARHRWRQRDALSAPRPFAVTANFAARRGLFERLGGFDPFFDTSEDEDFGWRLYASGASVRYVPSAAVFHRHRATVAGLFRQHAGFARGAALLHARHGLPWGARRELAMWARVGAAAGHCLWTLARRAAGRAGTEELAMAWCELARRAGQRTGAVAGQLAARRRLAGTP